MLSKRGIRISNGGLQREEFNLNCKIMSAAVRSLLLIVIPFSQVRSTLDTPLNAVLWIKRSLRRPIVRYMSRASPQTLTAAEKANNGAEIQ